MTKIISYATDMGNGGLDDGNGSKSLPKKCPKCNCEFTDRIISGYNFGGSDF